ncbi:MAG: hypothetical protein WCD70_17165 [Alphaproteobacteria bacterium]
MNSSLPPTNKCPLKDQLNFTTKEIIRRVKKAPAQIVEAVKKANRAMDVFEDRLRTLTVKDVAQQVKQAPAQAVEAVKKADLALDALEGKFSKASTPKKVMIVFAAAATSCVLPGGWIAPGLWGAKKAAKWLNKKLAKRGTPPPPPQG